MKATLSNVAIVLSIITSIILLGQYLGFLTILPNFSDDIQSCTYNNVEKALNCDIPSGRYSTDNPTVALNMYSISQSLFFQELFSSDYPVMNTFFQANQLCKRSGSTYNYRGNQVVDISSFTSNFQYIAYEPNSVLTDDCGTSWYTIYPIGEIFEKYGFMAVVKGTGLNDKGEAVANVTSIGKCTPGNPISSCEINNISQYYEVRVSEVKVYFKKGGYASVEQFCQEKGATVCPTSSIPTPIDPCTTNPSLPQCQNNETNPGDGNPDDTPSDNQNIQYILGAAVGIGVLYVIYRSYGKKIKGVFKR